MTRCGICERDPTKDQCVTLCLHTCVCVCVCVCVCAKGRLQVLQPNPRLAEITLSEGQTTGMWKSKERKTSSRIPRAPGRSKQFYLTPFTSTLYTDISRLTPIKDQLPPHVDFNHIKIVLAMLKFKYGVAGDGVLESSQSESDASASLTVSPVGRSSESFRIFGWTLQNRSSGFPCCTSLGVVSAFCASCGNKQPLNTGSQYKWTRPSTNCVLKSDSRFSHPFRRTSLRVWRRAKIADRLNSVEWPGSAKSGKPLTYCWDKCTCSARRMTKIRKHWFRTGANWAKWSITWLITT